MNSNQEQDRMTTEPISGQMPDRPAMFNPFQILVRRRWQFFACLLLVCTVAFVATQLRKTKYQASARVQLSLMDDKAVSADRSSMMGYLATQTQLLQSRRVFDRAAKRMNWTSFEESSNLGGYRELRDHVKIQPASSPMVIDIVGISENPGEAAAIANQMAASFASISMETKQTVLQSKISRLDQQISSYDQKINNQESKINRFREENLLTGSSGSLRTAESRISSTEQKLTAARLERVELAAKRRHLEQMLQSGEGLGDGELMPIDMSGNNAVRGLQTKIESLQQEELRLSQVYLSGHQKLRSVRIQIADLQAKLMDEKSKCLRSSYGEVVDRYDRTVKEEEDLVTLLKQYKEMGVEMTAQQHEYDNMLSTLKRYHRFRDECLSWRQELEWNEQMGEPPVTIVDAAEVPRRPTGLTKRQQAASILLLGLMLSLFFIFATDRMSIPAEPVKQPMFVVPVSGTVAGGSGNGFGSYWPNRQANYCGPGSVGNYGNYSGGGPGILGQLHTMSLGGNSSDTAAFSARCRLVQSDQSSPEAAAFREMTTRLLNRFGRAKQTMVVTSSSTNTGKTTCSVNLAMMLAQTGRRVLLVDANASAPSLSRVFGESQSDCGYKNSLSDRSLLDDAIEHTDVADLMVLHMGAVESGVDFEQDAFGDLHSELTRRFDWVIYDGDTINTEFTTRLLQAVGKVLLVTSPTDAPEIDNLARQVEYCGAVTLGYIENLGVVVSAAKPPAQQVGMMSG